MGAEDSLRRQKSGVHMRRHQNTVENDVVGNIEHILQGSYICLNYGLE